jgi:hypothetical protein
MFRDYNIKEYFFQGEKMPSKITTIFYSLVFVLSTFTFANAADLNLPGFTGSANSTVTTGFSARIDRNCESVRGYKRVDDTMRTFVNNGGYNGTSIASSSASTYLTDGEGCATRKTDGYGNAGNSPRDITSENADDGNMNFDGGDIFDATTRVYTEITGEMDSGVGVNLSLVGSYNAVDSFTSPTFKPFTDAQLDNIESDVDVLNAYITTDIDDLSITAGRFVTNWGESTFIPVGMNGLTTNAIDLVALRVPGASIKEALLPTEQITVSGYLDGGWSFEGYYQMNEEHIQIDEAGTYFGSEVASQTGNRLIFNGSYGSHTGDARDRACGYLATNAATVTCDADQVAAYKASAKTASSMYTMGAGLTAMFGDVGSTGLILKSATIAGGAAVGFGGSAGDIQTVASLGAAGIAGVAAGYAAWDEYAKKGGTKIGTLDLVGNGHIYADGDDQYGFALRNYFDDIGTGVEIGLYYTQFDSKVPYLRYKGQQGIYAGDLFGAFQYAASTGTTRHNYMNASAENFENTIDIGAETATEKAGSALIVQALGDLTFSSGACGAYMNPHLANEIYAKGTVTNFAYTSEEKANALDAFLYTDVNGELYFDAAKCAVQAGVHSRTATLQGAAALLGAAVTPLNMAEYEFIYPENNQAFGISMNTNVGAVMVNAEVTYRPDFPLHTAPTDQGQQLSDAAGTTQLLTMGVVQGIAAAGFSTALGSYQANVDADGTQQEMITAAARFKRSYLPAISLATVAAGDYYTTPYFEYDVFSGTIGTTSSFTASHPITAGLGADTSFLVTELGFVSVPDLSDTKPVNRGGYRDGVGGVKCGGANLAGTSFNSIKALDGQTHLASAQTDPLFGNGSYCESKNNADDLAMTYRLVGGASYNNFQNTAWTFSPSFVWSHDFKGYAPSTMGGWVPGKQSLSLTGTLSKGDTSIGLSYVNQLGDKLDNLAYDRDYISANVSYAF